MSEFIRELTEEERNKPYAKYFNMPLASVPEEKMKLAASDPLSSELINGPEDIPMFFKGRLKKFQSGWGYLENGAGYVANEMFFKNCTMEMIQWFFAWHPLEPLRYSLWDHRAHHSVAICDSDRKKILDPCIPLEEKSRGVVHFVVEDVGGGPDDILIHFMSPGELGFDMADFHMPHITGVIGGWGEQHSRDGKMDSFCIMLHSFKEVEDGIDMHTRFWMGYKYLKKRPVLMLPPGVKIPESAMRGLLAHSIEEYTNLAAILPELYRECGGRLE